MPSGKQRGVGFMFSILKEFIVYFLACIGLACGTAYGADTIWESHSKLVAAEQVTDAEVDPVYVQLSTVGQHTDSSLAAATSARLKLENARHAFLDTFAQLSEAEKNAFIAALVKRPAAEVLIYDFDPISNRIPRIAEIRKDQEERMYFPMGRSAQPAVNPRQLSIGTVEIDPAATTEVNGNGFGANQYNLTFDDGPNPRPSRSILGSLAEWGVKVNYFQCGNMIQALAGENARLVEEMYLAGHGMENHSWSHPQLTTLALANARAEIQNTYAIIERSLSAYNYRSNLFRFPFGSRNQSLLGILRELGVTSVMWNIDTLDWKYKDPAVIVDLARTQIQQQGKGIILMHDIHAQTALAVPHILQILGDRDATVVKLVPRR